MIMPNRDEQEIEITEGSKLHEIYKKSIIGVNSFHHQAVKIERLRNMGLGYRKIGIALDIPWDKVRNY